MKTAKKPAAKKKPKSRSRDRNASAGNGKPTPTPGANMLAKRPKPTREWLPLETLKFPPQLQLRDLPDAVLADGCIPADPATVALYREQRADGAEFPPLEVVKEVVGKKTNLWVFAGFTRGEMYRLDGVASVECLVYAGSFKDAEFWALSENSRHGKTRTPEECRKAFDKLVDSPSLLGRVLDSCKAGGGIQKGIATACGLSDSTVADYLKSRGKKADRHGCGLIDADAESPARVERREKVAALAGEGKSARAIAKELGVDHKTVSADIAANQGGEPNRAIGLPTPPNTDDETEDLGDDPDTAGGFSKADTEAARQSFGDPEGIGDALLDPKLKDALRDAQGYLRGLERVNVFLLRHGSGVGDYLREDLRNRGMPFDIRTTERNEHINDIAQKRTEFLPILEELSSAYGNLAAVIHTNSPRKTG